MLQWLMWQMSGLGPMAGQVHHFAKYAPEKITYAIDRYVKETARLYGVLDRRLVDRPYVAGAAYGLADIAIYPWVSLHQMHLQDLQDFSNIALWFSKIAARPAVLRAYEIATPYLAQTEMTAETKKILFGQTADSTKARE